MTIKQFAKQLRDIIETSPEYRGDNINNPAFITHAYPDVGFKDFGDDEVVCAGLTENEVFHLKITKVE